MNLPGKIVNNILGYYQILWNYIASLQPTEKPDYMMIHSVLSQVDT